jgi:hypothetical protein
MFLLFFHIIYVCYRLPILLLTVTDHSAVIGYRLLVIPLILHEVVLFYSDANPGRSHSLYIIVSKFIL